MPKAKKVPITGSVLRWAIQEEGVTEKDLALHLGVDDDVVKRWEAGDEAPTTTQFNRLVQFLKRPSAIFFLPTPPAQASVRAHFRSAPGALERRLNRQESHAVRQAKRLQEIASWLIGQLGESVTALPAWDTSQKVEEAAQEQRRELGISIFRQVEWTDDRQALRGWRAALEQRGVLVFQFSLPKDACRGFSLWDQKAPVIAFNSADPPYNPHSRIYTLFHEYGHLLLRADSICAIHDEQVGPSSNGDPERWCERFAAALLLPKEEVFQYLAIEFNWRQGVRVEDFQPVAAISRRYHVSLGAVALRLVELGAAGYDLYEEVNTRAKVSEAKKRGGGGNGLRAHELRVQEFGRRLPSILLAGMRKDVLRVHDVLDYLDLSTANIADLERLLASK
ncbi:MAG: ImmA/IrrE family metallo-endopeptidase [Chloroflexi bacterium]|nr:ImmA/IrrE family metallo-endopeptidase [Chloroflexota bacterium]